MDHDVSLHDLVELFVASPTSPRSSKTESGCKRYARFRIAFSAVFSGAEILALWPEIPAPGSFGPIFSSEVFG